jgi:hypothetical protein
MSQLRGGVFYSSLKEIPFLVVVDADDKGNIIAQDGGFLRFGSRSFDAALFSRQGGGGKKKEG